MKKSERKESFHNSSRIELKAQYTPEDWQGELPTPGAYPYTRGV